MTIEIIGRACIAPKASSIRELQQVLRDGRSTVSRVPRERWDLARFWHPVAGTQGKTYTYAAGILDDIYAFDPGAFGLSQREAMQMDPQQRILLNLTLRALEDANLRPGSLHDERVGVYIGASALDNGNLAVEDPASGSPYFMTGNTLSIISNRISHVFGLHGPSMTIDTACSSSLVALDQAFKALERADIDTAIVGGINLVAHPLSFVGFAQARMLSPDGLCRAYDNRANGYVRSEGGVIVVLRRTDRASREKDRSHATIHAIGVNSSGRTNGISLPSREAQADLLRSIYAGGNFDLNRIAFIEGHGTGTKVGDPAEVWAIGDVIGRSRRAPVPIGSIKSNIGHTEPVSGLFGLLKAMIALESNFLPASLHVERANESIDFEGLNVRVNTSTVDLLPAKEPRYVGVNSFGFGGTNAHVLISDPSPVIPSEPQVSDDGEIFIASAHSATALSRLLHDYKARIERADAGGARQIVQSAAANRELMRHRFAVKVRNSHEALTAINAHLAGSVSFGERGEIPGPNVKIAFVFSGNGSQWAGMGADAYRENRSFRQYFQSFSALFEYYLGEKLTDVLLSQDLSLRLADTKVAQPLLFAVQAALSDCLHAAGIRPETVFGHSVGEIAAAYAAKSLTAAEAVAIVAKRSQHQDLLAGQGKMAAVVLEPEAALSFARAHGLNSITIAAINASNSVTISGPTEEVEAFRDAARNQQIVAHVLDINYPFHHPIIDGAKDAFLKDLPEITPENGCGTFISTVTGTSFDGRLLDAQYWWRNVRDPVLFEAACRTAIATGCNLFIEISPRPILLNYISEIASQQSALVVAIPTLLREITVAGKDPVSQAFARVIAHGATPFNSRGGPLRNAYVRLPQLPFEAVELRPQSTSDEIDVFGRDLKSSYTLLGWRTDPNGASWKNHLDAHLFADLAEHVVDSKAIMPGSGFIEIAATAAQQYYRTDEVEISNLEIVRALELRQDRMVELSTILSPETGNIEIRSRERLSNDDWTIHATARSRRPLGVTADGFKMPVAGEKRAVLSPAEAYDMAERFGLQYGPRFRLLSKAVAYGQPFVEVDLSPAANAAHPFIEYNLNPMSVDAAFHGLVAVFDQLSGDEGGAPYIPVHFGRISVSQMGQPIAKAVICIERASRNSIKARFRLLDPEGRAIATFDDCRFRRTFLRRHDSLASAAIHFDSVPSTIRLQSSDPTAARPDVSALMPSLETHVLNNATLLLEAAIYRACYEIADAVSTTGGLVSASGLPGDRDFRSFLTNCLYVLEDAGIASAEDGKWRIPSSIAIPPVADILRELYSEDSGRVAEGVLVNNVYCDAMERLADLNQRRTERVTKIHATGSSEATVEHVLAHSALSSRRLAVVTDALKTLFTSTSCGTRHVLEAGSTSVEFSRRLSLIAFENNAVLIIAEPREHLRRALQMAFEQDAHVIVPEPDRLADHAAIDAIVSAGEFSQHLLAEHEGVRAVVREAAEAGATLLLADRAPSIFNDFAFGLSPNWFTASQLTEFPLGRLGTPGQVEDILASLGFSDVRVEERTFPEGALITAVGIAEIRPSQPNSIRLDDEPLLIVSEPNTVAMDRRDFAMASLDPNATETDCLDAFAKVAEHGIRIVYIAVNDDDQDVSQLTQDRLSRFATLAKALSTHVARSATPQRPRLLIVAPGGSPLATKRPDAANAGLWAFARVLQNEHEFLDVHLLDAASDDPRLARAVSSIMATSLRNREWLLDGASGDLLEVRVSTGGPRVTETMSRAVKAATIRQNSNRLMSLAWEACELPVATDSEVIVAVEATGLNFRDVMWAMGLLPEEALEDGFAGATIGMEFAGRVVGVGAGVSNLSPGDKVMGIGPAAFSTHVRVHRDGVARLPAGLDPVAAATVPVAFLTAYYAMVELGRIAAGETILIHGAAGGVGLAALQIAKLKGARIIATAGTLEKRRFLKLLGADHVSDSRSLDFVNDVQIATNGKGVDLVLNSLFSEAMERSLELVKPFGRFLELGKRDYYADRKIGLRPFRRNISYFGIDADQLLVEAPEVTRRIFQEIGRLFAEDELKPLPYRMFSHDEIGSAFRLMQNAGHIGKIVVRPPTIGVDRVLPAMAKPLRFDPNGIFVVAGGIGGFGLSAAEWIVAKGARRIALCSRRGAADERTLSAIKAWNSKGVVATLHACDVTDETAVEALLASLRSEGPLAGIVHAAMILDDALLENLNRERNQPVVDVKVRGAEILHRLTREDDLQLFLLFSSVTTMFGNPGQSNYVIANGYLEGLARRRRSQGLLALAVGFGAITDTGFLARKMDVNEMLSKRIGKTGMKAREALAQVERYMAVDPGTVDTAAVVIAELDGNAVRLLPIADGALLDPILRRSGSHPAVDDKDTIDLAELIKGKTKEEAHRILHGLVAAEIATILRVTEDSITPNRILKDIGLDSLMAMELGMSFQQKTGFDIALNGVGDATTVADVVARLRDRISKKGEGGTESDEAERSDLVGQLARSHSAMPSPMVLQR